VALAPGGGGQVVTSERGVVVSVDPEACRLVALMDDGREQVFERDEMGAGQLAHGYATTVHRSQGATCGRGHLYEDGGGRELAYVAMSRAKEQTHVYVAADDADQASEDLARAWAQERRWRWAIDTGTPGPDIKAPASLRREALVAERAMLAAAVPPDVSAGLRQARHDRDVAARELEVLRADGGRGAAGELGRAAQELGSARQRRYMNEQLAQDKQWSRGARRDARRWAQAAAGEEQARGAKVAELFGPEERRLTEALGRADHQVGTLAEKDAVRARWLAAHPGALDRLAAIDVEIFGIDEQMDLDRWAVVRDLYPELARPRAQGHPLAEGRSPSYDYTLDLGGDGFGFGL
jgi:hypothetical protein